MTLKEWSSGVAVFASSSSRHLDFTRSRRHARPKRASGSAVDQWALHVPLGKLHTERLVPADDDIRRIVARMLALRALAPPARLAKSERLLLPRCGGHYALYRTLLWALADAA